MMKDIDIHTVATEIFARGLGPRRFERLEVENGLNHDGEPSFFVTLHFKPGVDPRDVNDSSRAHAALRRRLLDAGEDRFPYVRYRYADDEILIGEDEAEAS